MLLENGNVIRTRKDVMNIKFKAHSVICRVLPSNASSLMLYQITKKAFGIFQSYLLNWEGTCLSFGQCQIPKFPENGRGKPSSSTYLTMVSAELETRVRTCCSASTFVQPTDLNFHLLAKTVAALENAYSNSSS